LLLANLYRALGKFGHARAIVQPLASQPTATPQQLARYATVLLQSDDAGAAVEIINRLERLEPNSARTRQLKTALQEPRTK
jgi:Flp pilus assembly protein TadD